MLWEWNIGINTVFARIVSQKSALSKGPLETGIVLNDNILSKCVMIKQNLQDKNIKTNTVPLEK